VQRAPAGGRREEEALAMGRHGIWQPTVSSSRSQSHLHLGFRARALERTRDFGFEYGLLVSAKRNPNVSQLLLSKSCVLPISKRYII
jgi:hypothetical protein